MNSRLGEMVNQGAKDQRVVDGLGQLGHTGQRSTPIPPPQVALSGPESRLAALERFMNTRGGGVNGDSGEGGQVGGQTVGGQVGGNATAAFFRKEQGQGQQDLAPELPASFRPDNGSLVQAINQDISNDREFYTRTGRMPTESDKLLIQSRRKFMLTNRRVPRPDELLYEAQKSLMTQRGTRGVAP